jgi:hypothetical protein
VLLDYHSLYEQQPAPAPVFVPWIPPTKQRQRQIVVCTMDAELPAAEAAGTATVRVTGTIDATLPVLLLMVRALASYRLPGRGLPAAPDDFSDEALLALGAMLLLDDDDDD